jgi:hypothetical protein
MPAQASGKPKLEFVQDFPTILDPVSFLTCKLRVICGALQLAIWSTSELLRHATWVGQNEEHLQRDIGWNRA